MTFHVRDRLLLAGQSVRQHQYLQDSTYVESKAHLLSNTNTNEKPVSIEDDKATISRGS